MFTHSLAHPQLKRCYTMPTSVRRWHLPLRFASVLALFGAVATSAAATKTPEVKGGGESGYASVTVVNQSGMPVHATTLNLPADAAAKAVGVEANVPLELVGINGTAIPLLQQKSNGNEVLHAMVSLQPRERMEFKIRKAKAWGAPSATAAFDAQSGSGSLSNGILNLTPMPTGSGPSRMLGIRRRRYARITAWISGFRKSGTGYEPRRSVTN